MRLKAIKLMVAEVREGEREAKAKSSLVGEEGKAAGGREREKILPPSACTDSVRLKKPR